MASPATTAGVLHLLIKYYDNSRVVPTGVLLTCHSFSAMSVPILFTCMRLSQVKGLQIIKKE